jgi:bifunctional UDP-N-acetylglucosamine pyrophosphorylase/glucosamine-1-phosphate N-acetyltransferase
MHRPDHRAEPDGIPVPGTAQAPNPAAVVVLAAGEGKRMHSTTPKVLHEIAGRALLGHALHAAAALAP